MNALLIKLILVRRDLITLHVISVGMAACTRFRYMRRVNRGTRIRGRKDVVHAMAVNADGHFGISLLQLLAVHAGEVLALLISPKARVELSHVIRIGVATTAKGRNLRLGWSAPKALGRTHRVHGIIVAVPAMTIRATETGLVVNITGKQLRGLAVLTGKLRMAGHARVFCRRTRRNTQTTKYHGHANGTGDCP